MAMQIIEREEVIWRLRQLRAFARLTTRDVAGDTGVSKSTLSRIEAGEAKRLDYGVLTTLCAFYSRYTAVPVVLSDLLDPDFDTRVWRTRAA